MRCTGWALLAMAGCGTPTPTPPELIELEAPGGNAFELDPPVLARGSSLPVRLRSRRAALQPDQTTVVLDGAGVVLNDLAVLDGFTAFATIEVAEDAPLGVVPAVLTVGDTTFDLPELLTVVDTSFSLAPGNAKMGEVVDVVLTGQDTDWNDRTWVGFGPDVQTVRVQALSPTELTARVAIASDALPGLRDVTVEQGEAVTTLYDGFTIDRAVITASWDPPVVSQGETVAFRIEGVNTRFSEGFDKDSVQFWNRTAAVADLVIDQLVRESATVVTGTAQVSNAALPGSRDVYVADDEALLIVDALEILEVPVNPLDARLSLGMDVRRSINRFSGAVSDSVRATALFYLPLDPPCAVGFNAGPGPVPFDINGVFPVPPPVTDPVDCPEIRTVDAGDLLWFDGPENTVTLVKETNPNTGMIFYRGNDLELVDYHFGDTYDLRVQGAAGGIPPFTVEDAVPTVPEDYRFTSPSLRNLTIDRFADFAFEWTPAGVYPTGQFVVSLDGTLEGTADPAFVGVIPFDDGQHRFRPNQLSQLNPGDAVFSAFSRVEGRVFQLPYNNRNTQADSVLSTEVDVVLQ